ncbi:uncharacterized protein [Apostichopus japonicus]|uniref:uncharacterized protein isoform X1 n=1 Tax=Stichopus japonicus TaxID=307972 RepID=UPI003AB68094
MENLFIYGCIHNFYMFVLLCFTCAVAITPTNKYIALEGEDVRLVYHSDGFGRIFKDTGEDSFIINNGHLEGNPNKYGYSSTVSDSGRKHTLIIKNIDRNEAGVYSFMQEKPFKLISVTVLVNYRPSNPICSSSQKLIFFKDDVTNATAVLQCSLGDIGLPKSTLSFQFQNGSSVNSSVIISGNGLEASISILPSVRMNNSYISCIVRQDIPSSMSTTSFEDSCSFPPILFLEELQVMITPSMYAMNDSGNITFTCSSNAGPLDNVTWKIKSEVPNSVTNFAKHDQITFQVNNSKMSNNASIVFECFGKVRNHIGSANALLVLQHSSSESNMDSMLHLFYVACDCPFLCNHSIQFS